MVNELLVQSACDHLLSMMRKGRDLEKSKVRVYAALRLNVAERDLVDLKMLDNEPSKLERIDKRKARYLIGRLEKAATVLTGQFVSKKTKNGRGDYGYDETFSYKGEEVFKTSIDGARLDIWFYANPKFFEKLEV